MNKGSLSIEEAYAYCRRLTIDSDTNFSLGFRFLPHDKRRAIYALYAFNRFADDFVDETSDKTKGERLILQWKEKLNDCYSGNEVTHPILIAFSDAIRRYGIPQKPFDDAIDGFCMDLTINRYQSFADLLNYCDKVAGTISIMSLRVFGYAREEAQIHGQHLSTALQLTNIIRDMGKDIKKDRIYIPLNELHHFGYTENDLKNNVINDSFKSLMKFQVGRARSYFREANTLVDYIEPDSKLTTLLIGSVYMRILRKIEEQEYNIFQNNVRLTHREKLAVLLNKMVNQRFI